MFFIIIANEFGASGATVMQVIDQGILGQSESNTARATLTCPGVTSLASGTVLATYRAGSSKDGDDEAIELCRSIDHGLSWSAPRRVLVAPVLEGKSGTLKQCYLTERSPGHLLAAALWIDRSTYPGKPLFNPDTDGALPMAIVLAESRDDGLTWSDWRAIPMPEEIGPPSLTNPILVLRDGRLAVSIETNKSYLDSGKWYQRVVLRHSADEGKSWASAVVAGEDPTGRIYNWDQRLGVAPNGDIAAFLWTFDSETETFLNIHRRVSRDHGQTWSQAEDLGFADQAARPAVLPDGRTVLAWVDRFGSKSIRARLAPSIDGEFATDSEVVLYSQAETFDGNGQPGGALGNTIWTFGLPYADVMPDGTVLVLYYAGTEADMDVHWARIAVS